MAWIEENQTLHRTLKTRNFAEALRLVNHIGEAAEAANHHPDLELGWGYVRIHLTSHDQGCVTDQDRALAQKIDTILVGEEETRA